MSKKLNPAIPYLEQVGEASPESYGEWIREKIAAGLENKETLNDYHVLLSKNAFDETTGKRLFEPFVVIYDKWMMNPNFGDAKSVKEREGYTFTILHDPTGKAFETKPEPEDVVEPENVEKPAEKKGKSGGKGKSAAKVEEEPAEESKSEEDNVISMNFLPDLDK